MWCLDRMMWSILLVIGYRQGRWKKYWWNILKLQRLSLLVQPIRSRERYPLPLSPSRPSTCQGIVRRLSPKKQSSSSGNRSGQWLASNIAISCLDCPRHVQANTWGTLSVRSLTSKNTTSPRRSKTWRLFMSWRIRSRVFIGTFDLNRILGLCEWMSIMRLKSLSIFRQELNLLLLIWRSRDLNRWCYQAETLAFSVSLLEKSSMWTCWTRE